MIGMDAHQIGTTPERDCRAVHHGKRSAHRHPLIVTLAAVDVCKQDGERRLRARELAVIISKREVHGKARYRLTFSGAGSQIHLPKVAEQAIVCRIPGCIHGPILNPKRQIALLARV
jgi:hypothetical protein